MTQQKTVDVEQEQIDAEPSGPVYLARYEEIDDLFLMVCGHAISLAHLPENEQSMILRDRERLQSLCLASQGNAADAHPIMAEIMAEVEKATRKFPTWPTRLIDAGNVVSEEAGELAKACLQVTYEPEKETLAGAREEAIQTAAMCFRFIASMDGYDTTPGPQHEQPALTTYRSRNDG